MEWRGWRGDPVTVPLIQIDDHDGTTPRQYEAENPTGFSLDYGACDYITSFTDISYAPDGGGATRNLRARVVTQDGEGDWQPYTWPWALPLPPG